MKKPWNSRPCVWPRKQRRPKPKNPGEPPILLRWEQRGVFCTSAGCQLGLFESLPVSWSAWLSLSRVKRCGWDQGLVLPLLPFILLVTGSWMTKEGAEVLFTVFRQNKVRGRGINQEFDFCETGFKFLWLPFWVFGFCKQKTSIR